MGIRIWMQGQIEPAISVEAAEAFYTWLKDNVDTSNGDCQVYEEGFVAGWLNWYEHLLVKEEMLEQLPEGTSVELTCDFDDCDEPGKETTWHGPRAADLELRHVNEEIRRLVARKLELEIKMGLA